MVDKQKFIQTYGSLANDISSATGLDPTLVLGQIAHETGWGQHISGNNIFGISPGGQVAAFPSVPVAAQAYVDLINRRYPDAAQKDGIAGQAEALSRGGFGPNNSYGGKIANVANSVRAAGYAPSAMADQADAEEGKALFQQMTGTPAPALPEEHTQQTPIDVSSQPDVDTGKEVFKSIVGQDPDNPSSNPTTPTPSSPQTAAMLNTAGVGSSPPNAPEPSALQNLTAGAIHGLNSVYQPLVASAASLPGVAAIDRAVPALGALDKAYSPNPQDEAAYAAGAGQTLSGKIGNFAGQTAAISPLTGAIGSVGGAAANALSNPLLAGAARIGTSAVQGAVGAGATGGDVAQGALAGGALGVLGGGANALSSSMQNGGVVANMLHSKIADAVVHSLSGLAGYHIADIAGLLMGQAVGPVVKSISEKYGPKVAALAASALTKGNASGLLSGGAGVVGGQAANPLAAPP
jgi:hypothetical protein